LIFSCLHCIYPHPKTNEAKSGRAYAIRHCRREAFNLDLDPHLWGLSAIRNPMPEVLRVHLHGHDEHAQGEHTLLRQLLD
jgi:hypothetical protein